MAPPPDTAVLERREAEGGTGGWTVPAGHAGRYARRRQPARPQPAPTLRLATGVELLGASEGSGYVEEHHLARTPSGRVVQLTDLLFLVAQAAGKDGTSAEQVATTVSEQYGKHVTADNVQVLADKLRPLGILADADGSDPDVVEPDPLLALRLRTTVLGPTGVHRLTAPFAPLFFMPVVVLALAGLVALDLWLFLSHGLAAGLRESMARPALFLLAFGLVVLSAAFHECGHATACRVGGGKPGRMGAGIYLAWPAFYTDVTDAYRLDRRARLRTDLGGVYFSCLLVLALGGVYGLTRFEPLLLVAFLMQIEVVHQMLPFLRLDGYYVVSDLVGVPDLFRRTGPVLASMVPGTKPQPSVLELKPWVRAVVRVWVLTVMPVLLFNVGMILLNFPQVVSTAWESGARLVGGMSGAGVVTDVVDAVQLVFLVIPVAGIAYTFLRLFGQLGRKGWSSTAGRPGRRTAFLVLSAVALAGLVAVWWPDARYTPYRQGQHGTITDQGRALSTVGRGTPLFRSPAQARQPLPPLPPALSRAYSSPGHPVGTAPEVFGATTTAPRPSTTSPAAPTSSPAPGTSTTPGTTTATPDAGSPAPADASSPAPGTSPAAPSPATTTSPAPAAPADPASPPPASSATAPGTAPTSAPTGAPSPAATP